MTALDDADGDFHFVVCKLDTVDLPVFARGKLYLDFSDALSGPTGVSLLKLLWGIHGKTPPDAAIRLALHVDEETREARARIKAAVDMGDAERLVELGGSNALAFLTSPMLGCEAAEGLIALGADEAALGVLEELNERFKKAARPR